MTVDVKALAALAAEQEDQTKAPERADFEVRIPAAGVTVGRFIEYIELGKHKQPDYQGKKKPDAEMVRIVFELLAPKNIREEEVQGTPTKFADRITLTIKKSTDDKAGFKKLFRAMTYGRDIKHMAMMLGEAFVITVIHNPVGEGDDKKTYANIRDDSGVWQIAAPFKVDPLTEEKTAYPVAEPLSPVKIFLWKNPTKETWDSLFIDGTRTVKDAKGNETEVSKNWLQEKIIAATDFDGSPLMTLLGGVQALPTTEGTDPLAGKETPASGPETGKEKASEPKADPKPEPKADPAPKAEEPAEDPLKALGLA